MAARAIASCVGPPSATGARAVGVGGRRGHLAVLVEVWGAGGERAAIETALVRRVQEGFAGATGSTTTRLRAGLMAAHRHLVELGGLRPGARPLGAGASALAIVDGEAILGQAGPSLALRATSGRPLRMPESSPWLASRPELVDDPIWPPLGSGTSFEVHWTSWPADDGTVALLAPSTAAALLEADAAARLLVPEPRRAREAARQVLGDRVPVRHRVAMPARGRAGGPPSGPPSGPSAVPRDAMEAGGAVSAGGAWPSRTPEPAEGSRPGPAEGRADRSVRTTGRARAPLGTVARRAAASVVRFVARVLRSMLPARSEQDAYRREAARLAAAAVVALPVTAIALALVLRSGAPPSEDPATTPASGEPGAAEVRTTSGGWIALPGDPEDERRVVSVGGRTFVLDATTGRVDRVEGNITRAALARGQTVGEDTVADLLDIFWLATASGGPGGRVCALDAAGRIWALDDVPLRVPRAEQPGWVAVSRAVGYGGRLYVLDRSAGQIYRYEPDPGALPAFGSPGRPWLREAQELGDVIDFAIDGTVYVLDRGGRVRRYRGGVPDVAFAADVGTTDARSIYATPGSDRILVSDRAGGRVVVLSTNGAFREQLLLEPQPVARGEAERGGRFTLLHDAWWDTAEGLVYVVDGNLLQTLPYR